MAFARYKVKAFNMCYSYDFVAFNKTPQHHLHKTALAMCRRTTHLPWLYPFHHSKGITNSPLKTKCVGRSRHCYIGGERVLEGHLTMCAPSKHLSSTLGLLFQREGHQRIPKLHQSALTAQIHRMAYSSTGNRCQSSL